jgi:uncharacterized protein YuzE
MKSPIGKSSGGTSTSVAMCFYDRRSDIAFFRVKECVAVKFEEQDWGGVYGYDQDGEVVSVEIRFAENTLPKWLLAVMPGPDQ